MGTREALFAVRTMVQRCRDMNVDVYACAIDYRKAFDCVRHEKLMEILKEVPVDRNDLRIIRHLYWNQIAEVRVEGSMSEGASIRRGVPQGCVLSPLLFNLYAEAIFEEALTEADGGIKINGIGVNNIRYADDSLIVASNQYDLQQMINKVVDYSEASGLTINSTKTKVIVFSKKPVKCCIKVNEMELEQVSSVKYLGTILDDSCTSKKEVRSRIEQARLTLMRMKNLFTRRELSLGLRVRLLRCYVFTVLLYGAESWTLDANLEKRINAFELYAYRRMLRISWIQKITNETVLNRMRKQLEVLSTVKERKLRYLGHIMRGPKYEILRLIIEGKIVGRRSVGRRQNSWLKDLRRWFGCSSIELFRSAGSRIEIATWIANLRGGEGV